MERKWTPDKIPESGQPGKNKTGILFAFMFLGILSIAVSICLFRAPFYKSTSSLSRLISGRKDSSAFWVPADIHSIQNATERARVYYGRELIAHTAKYIGPKGSLLHISNGLNCQNCHLQAGTGIFANNYGSVFSLYPKFRARSGTVENLYRRVNDCIERSLNGIKLDTNGNEMRAIVAYISFIGSNVKKGKKAEGSGLKTLAFLDRAADPGKGERVYIAQCQTCHQPNGGGQLNPEGNEFVYPALWGEHSYNDGAGLYRISNFARYVRYNMPRGASFQNPKLTDEEAWDVAAFVNSRPRPHFNQQNDWPDMHKKPIDHPFGPYADLFTERQHKYGPFEQMIKPASK